MIEVRHPLPPEQNAAEDVSAAAFAAHRHVYRPKIDATASPCDRASRLVALADGRVVGTVRYRQEGKRLHALGLAVHPQEQRRGVGKALIAGLIERARQLGCSVVSAYTILEAGQLPPLSRLGFVVLSTGTPDVLESADGRPLTEAYLELPVAREGLDAKSRSDAIASEMEKFQGTWRQIAHVRDGVADPPEERGWEPRVTFTGDTFVVTLADGSIAIKGTFKLDPTREPKAVDWTDTFGPDAGKTFPAIYSLEEDRLIFCAADEGQERPKEFRAGPGQVLRVNKRDVP